MSAFLLVLLIIGSIIVFILVKKHESFCDTEECKADSSTIVHLKNVLKSVAPDAPNYDIQPGAESVTVNKENIYICLRNPNSGELYTFDVLLYVTLHELAHVISKTFSTKSHNNEFKNNFMKLLKRAYEKNLLSSNVSVPDDYCKKKSPSLAKILANKFLG